MERTQFVADRQTDRQKLGKNNMSPDPEGERHDKCNKYVII